MALQISEEGLRAMKRKDYHAAIRFFTEALAVEDDRASLLLHRGIAHAKLHDYDRAITDLCASVDRCPLLTRAWLFMAKVHLKQERYPDACRAAAEALRMDTASPLPYALIALARFHQGEYLGSARKATRALRYCAENTALSPSSAALASSALTLRALSHAALGCHAAAVSDLARAVDECGNAPLAHCVLAEIRAARGVDLAAALDDITALLRCRGASKRALYARALVRYCAGDSRGTIADCRAGLRA
eukprot:TRINITY_DN1494_c0_g1_i1.p2 TRINITY_DN1494_c0_g1~~TRINITY_DN1494_c0_g1_i1.p2  ORF type:complete len:266 (-),score=61.73 TRINITY_DN1494_c0_g1_i1:672-1415(-)